MTIYIAKSAHDLLKRLAEYPRKISDDGSEKNNPMMDRFVSSDWAVRANAQSGLPSDYGVYGEYTITENGRRVLREATVVDDSDPRAVGLR
ncbi:hypothetical protein ABNQ39_22620 [Azospirillum sp. A26]|uniref:hypothetical protein n=1 Tax=Azospirillum sp. A26 TaxID=3160607 RepID=UPI00366C0253